MLSPPPRGLTPVVPFRSPYTRTRPRGRVNAVPLSRFKTSATPRPSCLPCSPLPAGSPPSLVAGALPPRFIRYATIRIASLASTIRKLSPSNTSASRPAVPVPILPSCPLCGPRRGSARSPLIPSHPRFGSPPRAMRASPSGRGNGSLTLSPRLTPPPVMYRQQPLQSLFSCRSSQ
jgi:hypothetical protein